MTSSKKVISIFSLWGFCFAVATLFAPPSPTLAEASQQDSTSTDTDNTIDIIEIDHLTKAHELMAKGKYKKALSAFRKALEQTQTQETITLIESQIAIAKTKRQEAKKAKRKTKNKAKQKDTVFYGGSASTLSPKGTLLVLPQQAPQQTRQQKTPTERITNLDNRANTALRAGDALTNKTQRNAKYKEARQLWKKALTLAETNNLSDTLKASLTNKIGTTRYKEGGLRNTRIAIKHFNEAKRLILNSTETADEEDKETLESIFVNRAFGNKQFAEEFTKSNKKDEATRTKKSKKANKRVPKAFTKLKEGLTEKGLPETTLSADEGATDIIGADSPANEREKTTGNTPLITLEDDKKTLLNSGTVSVTSAGDTNTQTYPHAVVANVAGANIINAVNGMITTTQANVKAIYIKANNVTITNQGIISTQGNNAPAIHSRSSSSKTLIKHLSGSISTTGTASNAIETTGASTVINIAGTVSTTGANANAIHSTGANSVITIEATGVLTASGANANMLYLRNARLVLKQGASLTAGMIDVDATVQVVDERDARQITTALTVAQFINWAAATSTNIEIASSGGVAVSSAVAVSLARNGAELINRGDIANTGTGTGAHGIHATSAASAVRISHLAGEITTASVSGIGIFVESGGNGVITVRGTIKIPTTNDSTSQDAINLADGNMLDLELGDGDVIQGRIFLGRAGEDSDGNERTHRIVVREGARVSANYTNARTIKVLYGKAKIDIYGSVTASGGSSPGSLRAIDMWSRDTQTNEPTSGEVTFFNGSEISATSGGWAILLRSGKITIMPSAKITGFHNTTTMGGFGLTIIDLRVLASLFSAGAKGTPSTRSNATRALRAATSTYRTAASLTGIAPITTIAATDTGASTLATAWTVGWTGKDVKLGFVDDTAANKASTEFVIKSVAPEANVLSATPTGASSLAKLTSATASFINGNPLTNIVLFATSLQRNASGSYATDTAWATLITDSLTSTAPYMDSSKNITNPSLPQALDAHDADMLVVLPAGDDKVACNTATSNVSIKDCNLVGGILAKKRQTDINAGDRVLFVGALTDDDGDANTADTMASYSLQAGNDLKYDFMVAYDDVHIAGDGARTAYAAARVTGAAALLRHKFISLDGGDLKQVLIQTADDLGATGPDPIFGMGKLNLGKALSPIGNMVTR